MAISASAQALVFVVSLLVGALLGVLYDAFRIIRLAVRCGKAMLILQDVIFLLACTLITFLFLLRVNSGGIRFFIIMGEILGAVIYYLTLGVLVMKLAGAIIDAVRRFKAYLKSRMLPPMKHFYAKIDQSIDASGIKVKKMLIKENKLMRNRLKVAQKMLYNLIYVKRSKKEADKPGADGHKAKALNKLSRRHHSSGKAP